MSLNNAWNLLLMTNVNLTHIISSDFNQNANKKWQLSLTEYNGRKFVRIQVVHMFRFFCVPKIKTSIAQMERTEN